MTYVYWENSCLCEYVRERETERERQRERDRERETDRERKKTIVPTLGKT